MASAVAMQLSIRKTMMNDGKISTKKYGAATGANFHGFKFSKISYFE